MFGQLSNRECLRDLIVAIDAHYAKFYHLGLGENVLKLSLERDNRDRDYLIFEEFAYYLVNEARQKRSSDIFKLGGNAYAFNSTTIDICLSFLWWRSFERKRVKTQIPAFFHITEASVHDSMAMK